MFAPTHVPFTPLASTDLQSQSGNPSLAWRNATHQLSLNKPQNQHQGEPDVAHPSDAQNHLRHDDPEDGNEEAVDEVLPSVEDPMQRPADNLPDSDHPACHLGDLGHDPHHPRSRELQNPPRKQRAPVHQRGGELRSLATSAPRRQHCGLHTVRHAETTTSSPSPDPSLWEASPTTSERNGHTPSHTARPYRLSKVAQTKTVKVVEGAGISCSARLCSECGVGSER